jgi:hypothetical protein
MCAFIKLLLRRTLVLLELLSTVDGRLSKIFPNAQVSDTTGDTQRTNCLLHKKTSFYSNEYTF